MVQKSSGARKRSTRKVKQEIGERQIRDKFKQEREVPPIIAKNDKQKKYLKFLETKQVIIAEGSSGSGKTFLVSCVAADRLRKGEISKIIVSRPYVQTGRSSGAKPGSSLEKLYPYVRNMLDTMKQRLGVSVFENALKDGLTNQIEVQELESIRGRSFDEPSVLIIDEAQQTTPDEMISIITRISDNCQLILCGDPHQKDIKGLSGLEWFASFTKRHGLDVGVVNFTSEDIVRGGMVKDIVKGLEMDGYEIKGDE